MELSLDPANIKRKETRKGFDWRLLGCFGGLLAALIFFNLINSILPTADDVTLYFNYARRTLSGEIPFIDFKIEYPPFSLVFFILPALFSFPLGGLNRDLYACFFHLECFLFEAGTLWLSYLLLKRVYPLARITVFTPRLIWFTLGGLAISLYLLQRFDIGVAFLLTLGLYLIYDQKPGWSGIVLAMGASAKLYPAIVLPFAVFYLWRYQGNRRQALHCLAGFTFFGAVFNLPFLILNPWGYLSFLKFHIERGIEIESVFATIGVMGHYLKLAPAISINDHNSLGLTSQWVQTLATFSTFLTVAGLLALFYFAWKATKPGNQLSTDWLIQVTALGVLWFILANKVLSPQYLIWMLGFLPFWKGVKKPLLLIALLLSILPFPFLIDWLFLLDWLPMAILATRNGLLLIILFQLIPALEAPETRIIKAVKIVRQEPFIY